MTALAAERTTAAAPDPEIEFYRDVMQRLETARVPFLVGGAYAFFVYSGIERNTKDLDLFLRRSDYDRAARVLAEAGYQTEFAFPHWLGKAHGGEWFVDLIFDSGNGAVPVDDAWFAHAVPAEVMGVHAKIVPVEEMIWSKAYIMERERFDGADVAHMLLACADKLDWQRLVGRFGTHWRVLLSHLVLFGFIYPAERARVPAEVIDGLLLRLREETATQPAPGRLCRGTLLSREQYLHDVQGQGYIDGRLEPVGTMTPEHVAIWTEAIEKDK